MKAISAKVPRNPFLVLVDFQKYLDVHLEQSDLLPWYLFLSHRQTARLEYMCILSVP